MTERSHELQQENARLLKDQEETLAQTKSTDIAAREKLLDMAAQLEQVNAELVRVRAHASVHEQELQRALADHAAARECVEKLEASLTTQQQVRIFILQLSQS